VLGIGSKLLSARRIPVGICIHFPFQILGHPNNWHSLVDWEALVQAFSPGSTLEPGLKAFC
jgi:hypothetical protein